MIQRLVNGLLPAIAFYCALPGRNEMVSFSQLQLCFSDLKRVSFDFVVFPYFFRVKQDFIWLRRLQSGELMK